MVRHGDMIRGLQMSNSGSVEGCSVTKQTQIYVGKPISYCQVFKLFLFCFCTSFGEKMTLKNNVLATLNNQCDRPGLSTFQTKQNVNVNMSLQLIWSQSIMAGRRWGNRPVGCSIVCLFSQRLVVPFCNKTCDYNLSGSETQYYDIND